MGNETEINIFERIWKLWTMICKMIMEGTRDAQEVAIILQSIVDGMCKGKIYLRRLFVSRLGVTNGIDNYKTAKKVFKGWFDADFENYGIIFSGIAPETDIAVDELVENGKFSDFLGNTREELERRRILGAQFLKYSRDNSKKLIEEGFATFAVVTKDDKPVEDDLSNVFVALAYVRGGGLRARVFEFSYGFVWLAECRHRILDPQQ